MGWAEDYEAAASGPGVFLAAGDGLASSPDGVTWTARVPAGGPRLHGVSGARPPYVAVGDGGVVLLSSNGLSWAGVSADTSAELRAVARGVGGWVAVGGPTNGPAVVLFSTNGTAWNAVTSGASNRLDTVAFSGETWLAAGRGGTACLSTNGQDWSVIDTGSGQDWHAALYADHQFWLFGDAGAGSSPDGWTWSLSPLPTTNNITGAAYGGYYCAVAGTEVLVSAGGLSWSPLPVSLPATNSTLRAVTFARNRFAFAGQGAPGPVSYGTVSQSVQGAGSETPPPFSSANTVSVGSGTVRAVIGLPDWKVNLNTLDFSLEGTLFSAPTPVGPLELRLGYNSRNFRELPSGVFGRGWMASFEEVIAKARLGTNATYCTTAGDRFTFTAIGPVPDRPEQWWPVFYTAPSGTSDELRGMSVRYCDFERSNPQSPMGYHYSAPVWGTNELFGRLTRIQDFLNNRIEVIRDGTNATIESVQYTSPNGNTRALVLTSYVNCPLNGNPCWLCRLVVAPDGRQMSFEYDGEARMTAMTDMQGYRMTFAYGPNGIVAVGAPANSTSVAYGSGGAVASATDAAGSRTFTRTGAGGFSEAVAFSSAAGRALTVSSTAGMLSEIRDAQNHSWSREYDYSVRQPTVLANPAGAVTMRSYNILGQMTMATDALGARTTLAYDENKNLKSLTLARGETWQMQANFFHQLDAVISPSGASASFQRDPTGWVTSSTDARGFVSQIERDRFGNITKYTDPAGGATSYEYDASGLRCLKMTDPRGNVKTLEYDNNDRITRVVTGGGERRMVFNATGQIKFINELGQEYTAERNAHGKITRLSDPAGNSTRFTYDADQQLASITDPLGHVQRMEYDESGRMERETDPLGGVLEYEHNEPGDVTRITNKRGNATAFAFDANHHPTRTTPPVGAAAAVQYNEEGRPVRWSWQEPGGGEGGVVTAEYNTDNRVTRRTMNGTEIGAFTYDPNGNLLSCTDPTGVTQFRYDALNRCTNIVYPGGASVSCSYDAVGNCTQFKYPDGSVAGMTYDNANRLPIPGYFRNGKLQELPGLEERPNRVTALSFGAGTLYFDFDAAGRLTGVRRPNSVNTVAAYNSAGKCRLVTHATGTSLFTATYGYDAAGNCVSEELQNGGLAAPLPEPLGEAVYDAGDRLGRFGLHDISHDTHGNLTACDTYSAVYDAQNKLTSLTRSGTTTVYVYNGLGWLMQKTSGGQTTRYYYGPGGVLLAELHPLLGWKDYFQANGRLVAYRGSTDATLRYVHSDVRGNVVLLTDSLGQVTARYAYSPYGLYTASGETNGNVSTFAGSLGVRDEGAGLFFMEHRFYDANLGRFLSTDPLGLSASPNLYAYANGNPLTYADPRGLSPAEVAEEGFQIFKALLKDVAGDVANSAADQAIEKRSMNLDSQDVAPIARDVAKDQAMKFALTHLVCPEAAVAYDVYSLGKTVANGANLLKDTLTTVPQGESAQHAWQLGSHFDQYVTKKVAPPPPPPTQAPDPKAEARGQAWNTLFGNPGTFGR